MFKVELDEKAKENGLAVMISQLIEDNLRRNSWKEKDASCVGGEIFIYAKDADVKVSLSFRKDKVVIFDGEVYSPDIEIHGTTADLIDLSRIKLVKPLYIPMPDKLLVSLVKKIVTGEMKIKFNPKKLRSLFHLVRVFSVYP